MVPAAPMASPAPLPASGRLLALDWGEVRFGIAASDELQIVASPVTTLTRRRGKRFPMPAFLEVVARLAPAAVVIGLPLEADGTEGDKATEVRTLAGTIARRTGLPVSLADERFTTARALGAIREQGGSVRGRREEVDALAAAVLLQQVMDSRRREA